MAQSSIFNNIICESYKKGFLYGFLLDPCMASRGGPQARGRARGIGVDRSAPLPPGHDVLRSALGRATLPPPSPSSRGGPQAQGRARSIGADHSAPLTPTTTKQVRIHFVSFVCFFLS